MHEKSSGKRNMEQLKNFNMINLWWYWD